MRHDTPPASGGDWIKRLQIALPLFIGVALLAVVVVLLADLFQGAPPEKSTSAGTPVDAVARDPRLPVPLSDVPRPDVPPGATADDSPRVYEPGLKRWGKLEPLPKGWDPEVASHLASLFGLIDFDRSRPETMLASGEAWEELQEYLKQLGPDALPTLAHILNREPTYLLRKQLLKGIGYLGETDAATFVLRDYFLERSKDLRSRAEMNQAISAIGNLKNDTSYDTMLEMIDRGDIPLYFKDKFIVELGEHPRREESRDVFKDMLFDSTDQSIRNHSAQALKKFGNANDLPDLYDAYDREKRRGHWIIRQTILGAIGSIGDTSSIPFLEEEARFAKEDGVRLSAARALYKIGTPDAQRILQDIGQNEREAGVRGRIQGWLAKR